jgi:hypothetical protein
VALKKQSLGSAGAIARCLTVSTTTNATPIVATFGANHGLKSGDIVALAAITGNTAANGVWQLNFTGANTAQLISLDNKASVGNGTHGGTALVGVVMARTPFLRNHSAVMAFGAPGAVATVFVEAYASYADFALATPANPSGAVAPVNDPAWTNTNGNATTTPASSSLALTAAAPGNFAEISALPQILSARLSAWTSGAVQPNLLA